MNSKAKIAELISAGMNVARLNCSHGDWETKKQWITWIRELSAGTSPVGILVDLQGPKFRLGPIAGDSRVLNSGEAVSIGADPDCDLPVPGNEITNAMREGDRVVLGDGFIELKLGKLRGNQTFDAKVVTGGLVRSKQGVTLMGKSFEVSAMTAKDRDDLFMAVEVQADFVALSYVRRAADMRDLRHLLEQFGSSIQTVAKIETKEAFREIDQILKVSDNIMVARGDLGLQMDFDEVPIAQKRIIKKCNIAGKPVITATQMLESMVENARPTRAEATDVANAILDGTDAVMLSGETANGKYPIEAVKVMSDIAETAEGEFDFESHYAEMAFCPDTTTSVARAAVQLAQSLKAKAILTTSTSGLTPRMVSRFRPRSPILCTAWSDETHRQLSLAWGVETIRLEHPEIIDDVIHTAINGFLKLKRIKVGDTVVITAGVPAGKVGHTNLVMVETVS